MNCDQAEKWISRSLDAELEVARQRKLDEHLAGCASCSRLKTEWEKLGNALREEVAATLPDTDAAWADIRERIHESEAGRSKIIPWQVHFRWAAGLAALFLLSFGVYFSRPRPVSEAVPLPVGTTVEFVETEIPGASPMVYMDQESGWTVVWVVEGGAYDNGGI